MLRPTAFLACLAALGLAGCGVAFDNLRQDAVLDDASGDAIVVIGVQPRYRVAIARGLIADGQVAIGGAASINAYPEGGYIVGRLKAATFPSEYHIQLILPEGIGGFVPMYAPCGHESVASFAAPAGKVIYVGDVTFEREGAGMRLRYDEDFAAARAFMQRTYPALAPKLEPQPLATRPIRPYDCQPAHIPVPIYIHVPAG